MQRRWWMLVAVMVGGSACAEDPQTRDDQAPVENKEDEPTGGLSLSLRSVDSQGRVYRLRDATFTVDTNYWWYDGGAPPPSTVLSTEDDPDSDRLSVRLVPGEYRVTLGGDWYIERLTATGPERVQQVALLSEPTQFAYIQDQWYWDLEYRFGVDGQKIDFVHGDLNIDITIQLPGEPPPGYPWYDGGGVVLDAGIGWGYDSSVDPTPGPDAGVIID